MSIVTFILGYSGSGKTSSLRNVKTDNARLIQVRKKPLPFKSSEWKYRTKDVADGNIIVRETADGILSVFDKLSDNTDIVIVDDFQYVMAMEFMNGIIDKKSTVQGYDRFNSIAKNAYVIIDKATRDPTNRRYYFLSHLQRDDEGRESIKTIGKLLDNKIVLEGLVTIVLNTDIFNDEYVFSVRNNGNNTVKSPIGMFDNDYIPNDLALVDEKIREYYSITK